MKKHIVIDKVVNNCLSCVYSKVSIITGNVYCKKVSLTVSPDDLASVGIPPFCPLPDFIEEKKEVYTPLSNTCSTITSWNPDGTSHEIMAPEGW